VILREAGGFVSDCAGGESYLQSGDILVGNEAIHREMLKVLTTI
jgi:myo-inositol-1(or 4)-monophosphatase